MKSQLCQSIRSDNRKPCISAFPDLRHGPPDVGRERRVDVVDVHLEPLPPLLLREPLRRFHLEELGLEAVHHLFGEGQ